MDETEARLILERELEDYKHRSYGKLVELIGRTGTDERLSPSGIKYQVEVQVFWDDKPGGSLRILGCIDDGSLRAASSPLCDDFIMSLEGSLIGEP
jgi:hypothetical protein